MAASDKILVPQSVEDITPSWVQQVLQRDLPGVTITEVEVKGAISQDLGFVTAIVAFVASGSRNGKSERYSLIAKMSQFSRIWAVMPGVPEDSLHKTEAAEVCFFSIAVPELLSVLDKHTEGKLKAKSNEEDHPGDDLRIPRCYFAATDPKTKMSVRIMENLQTEGFSIKSTPLLNRDEMMLVVGAYARIHGLSHRLELQSGVPIPKKYDWIFDMKRNFEQFKILLQESIKGIAAAFPDKADLVARLEKIDLEAVITEYLENTSRLKVLSHGDCWINNIMLKYEQDVPIDVKLVDWQTVTYLPPTCDLAELFLCCADWDTFHNHRDAILAHYHQELHSVLDPAEARGLHLYTLEDLKADFKADCLYGVISSLLHVIVMPTIQPDLLRMYQEITEWGVI